MVSDNLPPRETHVTMSRPYIDEGSYVDWPAILAGGVFALAISVLLLSFGASLGLSLTSPYRGEGISAAWVAIATGIWFAWVMVTGFGAGGYLCGRMRRRAGDATADEVEVRDSAHGLIVWSTGALVGTVLAAMGVGGVLNVGGAAIGRAADVATEAVSSDYFANVMLRGATVAAEPQAQPAATQAPGGADDVPPPAQAPTPGAANIANIDPTIQQQIATVLTRSAASGEMVERDRNYLAQLVAANSELDLAAARTRVDEVNAEIAEVRAVALATVERARVAGVIFGFIAAATLLLGAVAALFAAAAGGRHRDEGLAFDLFAVRR